MMVLTLSQSTVQRNSGKCQDITFCFLRTFLNLSCPDSTRFFQSVENLRFWLEVNEFHKAVDNVQEIKANSCYNQKDLLTFAQEIYSTFIEEGSNLQINISEAQLVSIRNKLSSEEEVQRDLFDSAQREVYSLMSRHSYPRFLASYKSKATGETKLEKRFTRRNSTILPI